MELMVSRDPASKKAAQFKVSAEDLRRKIRSLLQPNVFLSYALWLAEKPLSDQNVERLLQLRHFLFFFCRMPDYRVRWNYDWAPFDVSAKELELQAAIVFSLPWGTINMHAPGPWIPTSEWSDVAESGLELIKQFIQGPYQTWRETEPLRDDFRSKLVARGRILQNNPSYLAVLQLRHTIDRF